MRRRPLKPAHRDILSQGSAASELTTAIQTVTAGRTYLIPLLQLEDPRLSSGGSKKRLPKFKHLTPRQREILQLIGAGNSTKETAKLLFISLKTVEFHKSKIMESLGFFSTAGLTRYAVAHGATKL